MVSCPLLGFGIGKMLEAAAGACRKELNGRMKGADVVEASDQGYLSADEAALAISQLEDSEDSKTDA